MPFTLRINFTGMCLFVRDGDAMHVLMPGVSSTPTPSGGGTSGTPHHGGGTTPGTGTGTHVEPHAARLAFDTAHLRPDRVQLDGITAMVSLRNQHVEVPRVGTGFVGTLPHDLVRVGRPIKPEVFDPFHAADLLNARVSLRAGQCTDHDPGACWDWVTGPRAMSHVVEWSIENYPGDFLEQPMSLLGGGTGGRLGPLYPVNGVVLLDVWHVPHAELPPMDGDRPDIPPVGSEAHHFSAYDRLLQSPVAQLPKFSAAACSVPGTGKFPDKGRVGYSCISATL